MPNFKRCPVCSNMLRSYGKKTCGGTDCIRTWKSWSSTAQHQAMTEAENPNLTTLPHSNETESDQNFLDNILKQEVK